MIVAVAGVLSFGSAFVAGWFTKPAAVMGSMDPNQTAAAAPSTAGTAQPYVLGPTVTSPEDSSGARAMTEQQLKELVYEVREKIQEYNQKLQTLEQEKQRLRIAQQTLKKDIETLNNLRVDLAAAAATVKNERDMLAKTRVQVEKTGKANLVAIAAAYDTMDAASASEILTSMATGQAKNGKNEPSANIDDAVKILHFMQDRTKAKVLAELVNTEPALAALLCQKLKQVQEGT
jgi:chromosome segregation ATPase